VAAAERSVARWEVERSMCWEEVERWRLAREPLSCPADQVLAVPGLPGCAWWEVERCAWWEVERSA